MRSLMPRRIGLALCLAATLAATYLIDYPGEAAEPPQHMIIGAAQPHPVASSKAALSPKTPISPVRDVFHVATWSSPPEAPAAPKVPAASAASAGRAPERPFANVAAPIPSQSMRGSAANGPKEPAVSAATAQGSGMEGSGLPDLPFTYLGQLAEEGQVTVFLRYPGGTAAVRQGDLLAENYLVRKIDERSITLVYQPLNLTQVLTTHSEM